jgi:hypothetical protein
LTTVVCLSPLEAIGVLSVGDVVVVVFSAWVVLVTAFDGEVAIVVEGVVGGLTRVP